MDKFIDWNKDFIGKKEAIKEKDNGPNKKLVTMVVSTKDIDVISDEAIIKNNNCVGYVTSGGYAHYIKKSIAFGYVSIECAKDGTNLEIEINGINYSAYVTNKILYDPLGGKMRS